MKSLKFVVALLSIVVLVPCTAAFAADTITVTSFGGAFSTSQIEAYQKPFMKKTLYYRLVINLEGFLVNL